MTIRPYFYSINFTIDSSRLQSHRIFLFELSFSETEGNIILGLFIQVDCADFQWIGTFGMIGEDLQHVILSAQQNNPLDNKIQLDDIKNALLLYHS